MCPISQRIKSLDEIKVKRSIVKEFGKKEEHEDRCASFISDAHLFGENGNDDNEQENKSNKFRLLVDHNLTYQVRKCLTQAFLNLFMTVLKS